MMTLRGFVLVITTVLLRHFTVAADESGDALAVRIVVGCCVVFCCLGKACAAIASLRTASLGAADAWRAFELRRAQLEWIWVGALPWMLALSGFGALLAHAQADGWPHVALLAAWFVPSLVFLIALDFSAVQLEDDLLHMASRRRLGHTAGAATSKPTVVRWLARIRLGTTGGVIMCLVPVLVAIGAIDIVDACLPGLSAPVQGLTATLVLATVCLTLSPRWMKWWIGARPALQETRAQQRVAEFSRQLKVRAPAVMSVTGSPAWQGAALVGWSSAGRQLWLGSSLESQLSHAQLDMVLLHELAHLRRGHCWWRLGTILACGAIAAIGMASTSVSDSALDQAYWIFALAAGSTGLLSWSSRWCELDADAQACRYAADHCDWAGQRPARAAGVLCSALARLHGPTVDAQRWYWLHPSLARRKASLAKEFQYSGQGVDSVDNPCRDEAIVLRANKLLETE